MMQHVLKFGSLWTTRYNDYLKTRLTYNYQTSEGLQPLQVRLHRQVQLSAHGRWITRTRRGSGGASRPGMT